MFRRFCLTIAFVTALALLSGCGVFNNLGTPAGDPTPSPEATSTVATDKNVFDSQFTVDGTFQSHVDFDGVDFVYTIWPTKSTPRTNDWFPRGNKYFSFTLTAYDLDRKIRDPFRTKRNVYLSNISVSSRTTTESGAVETPYTLNATASRITFDPEPVKTRHGMLITSPKGAFELRNQAIGDLAPDTQGVTLIFEATVHIQRSAKSKRYYTEIVRQEVPIRIFASDTPTIAQQIPINAN